MFHGKQNADKGKHAIAGYLDWLINCWTNLNPWKKCPWLNLLQLTATMPRVDLNILSKFPRKVNWRFGTDQVRVEKAKRRKSHTSHSYNRKSSLLLSARHCTTRDARQRRGALSLLEPDHNDGNFRASLRLRLHAGDSSLQWHLQTSLKNANYLSWKIYN